MPCRDNTHYVMPTQQLCDVAHMGHRNASVPVPRRQQGRAQAAGGKFSAATHGSTGPTSAVNQQSSDLTHSVNHERATKNVRSIDPCRGSIHKFQATGVCRALRLSFMTAMRFEHQHGLRCKHDKELAGCTVRLGCPGVRSVSQAAGGGCAGQDVERCPHSPRRAGHPTLPRTMTREHDQRWSTQLRNASTDPKRRAPTAASRARGRGGRSCRILRRPRQGAGCSTSMGYSDHRAVP